MYDSVYVAHLVGGPVKIGASTEARKRVTSLRAFYRRATDSDCEITLAYVANAMLDESIMCVERRAHRLLSAYRVTADLHKFDAPTEWFNVDVATAIRAVEQAAADLDFEIDTVKVKAPPGFMSAKDIRERFGWPSRAHMTRRLDNARFPAAKQSTSGFRIWRTDDVLRWERRMIERGITRTKRIPPRFNRRAAA